jgi:septal ring factor EnvC (AmiA/AmiB activator)
VLAPLIVHAEGWGSWAWSWVAADTSGEAARVDAWKAEEREYEEWYASTIRKRPNLSNSITSIEKQLAQLRLRQKLLSGDKIQRELEKLESQKRGVNTQLIDAEPKLQKLRKQIERLTIDSNNEQALLEALVRLCLRDSALNLQLLTVVG